MPSQCSNIKQPNNKNHPPGAGKIKITDHVGSNPVFETYFLVPTQTVTLHYQKEAYAFMQK